MKQHPSTGNHVVTPVEGGESRPLPAVVEGTLSTLTPRQRQVFLLIGEGKMYAEIARALHLSRCRVTQHRCHIMRKLGLGTKAELLQVAVTVRVQLGRPSATEGLVNAVEDNGVQSCQRARRAHNGMDGQ